MNKMKPFIIAALFLLFTLTSLAQQKGTIRGTVFDGSTGETLVGVSVVIKDPFTGTATDLDGKFSLEVDPGTYTLQLSFISFQPLNIENVEVKPGEVTVLNNLSLTESTVELRDVVVTASAIRNTDAALNTLKAKSSVMLDGISAAKIELIGDGTAVEAAKRVTGVTIEDGKYIYVRGLGDRYSKTILNGMDIPGLDPDRNSLQMDIFPTSIIDNMVVSKNFTADLPADFTGGLMNITTKDFPDKKIFNISVSTTYNPNVHFNPDYLTYDGGDTDFLGFDDGTRALPDNIPPTTQLVPSSANAETIYNFVTKDFTPTLAANTQNSLLDYSASISFGNQIELAEEKGNGPRLGYIFSLSYKSKYKFDDEVLYAVEDWDGNLKETYMNNYDLRWEIFWDKGQNLSASIFYKQFDDPIELVRFSTSYTSTEYQPRNVGEGTLYGFEFEFSKNIDFIAPVLKNFNLSGNLTITHSEIDMTESEYLSRKEFEKDGENINKTRDMAGQSPYVINAGFTYNNYETGWAAGLFYNVKGSTLTIVGGGVFPDMYTEPFHSLNFSLNKRLGKEKKTKIDFKVSNILDQTQESYFKSYKAKNQPYSIYHPGREFSIGLSHSF